MNCISACQPQNIVYVPQPYPVYMQPITYIQPIMTYYQPNCQSYCQSYCQPNCQPQCNRPTYVKILCKRKKCSKRRKCGCQSSYSS